MSTDQLKQDLDYVVSTVRRHERQLGVPAIHFLWAAIILVGFALPDFAPRSAGLYWFVAGLGGGLLSGWLGSRHARRFGVNDRDLGVRLSLHWSIAFAGFVLCGLPAMLGRVAWNDGVSNYMLVAGLVYAMAGVHLVRPLLWIGGFMLLAYAAMVIAAPPYAWTISGVVIALALTAAGVIARGEREVAAAE